MILTTVTENIDFIIKSLLAGEVIIFPTDTVFGIGCIATNDKSIEKIYKLKERDFNKSLLLNVANKTAIKKIAKIDNRAEKIIDEFMPGGLSIVCKVKENNNLSKYVINNCKIGIRIPKNKILQTILKKIKTPLVSTSCNKSGEIPVTSSIMAEKKFPEISVLQETEKLLNQSSTIIDVSDKEIKFIREGAIKFKEIDEFLKSINN